MVFKITKRGVETALHSFGYGSGDGVFPSSSLVKVGDALFGTTTRGGAYVTGCEDYGCGTVFQITPAGVETVVHSFSAAGSDGVSPGGGLLNVGGTLYGTAQGGGANSYGTVFSVTPEGAFAVLYSFKGGSDGEYPDAGLIAAAGVLYGTTSSGGAYGGRTVFALTSTGAETVLHSFGSTNDGSYPYATLLKLGDKLYGTTLDGGKSGNGTVFVVSISGTEKVLHSFAGQAEGDGSGPFCNLINVGGTLYGTTAAGGTLGHGVVFKISP